MSGSSHENIWRQSCSETGAKALNFDPDYELTLCARDKRTVVVLRPPRRGRAQDGGRDGSQKGQQQMSPADLLAQAQGVERLLPEAVRIQLALDRCDGRWEMLAAEMVAFEPDHRARIRVIKAAAERRADDLTANLERQRLMLSVQAKVEEARLDEGYPSTPRSDRESAVRQSPSPDGTSQSASVSLHGRTLESVDLQGGAFGGAEQDAIHLDTSGFVRVSPLPLSGANVSFDAMGLAVDSEPTLLWKSIDAATAEAAQRSESATASTSLPVVGLNTARGAARPQQSGAASVAVASGTWGADGYPSFPWQGERDPLVGHESEQDAPPASLGDDASGEEAPLRDIVFRLFNDAADAVLADAAAQKRRAAGK